MSRQRQTRQKSGGGPRTLKQLKRQALKLATGYVKRIKINPFLAAYVYLRWESDEFLSGYLLGYTPTVEKSSLFSYCLDKFMLEEMREEVRGFLEDEVQGGPRIRELCEAADDAFEKENPHKKEYRDYDDFMNRFFYSLDDETEEARDELLAEYKGLIKSKGGKVLLERLVD